MSLQGSLAWPKIKSIYECLVSVVFLFVLLGASSAFAAPDFYVVSEDIEFSPSYCVEGTDVIISVRVHNAGDDHPTDGSIIWVQFYRDDGGPLIGSYTMSGGLGGGEFKTATVTWNTGGVGGSAYDVVVIVNEAMTIAENDYSNNTASKAIGILSSNPTPFETDNFAIEYETIGHDACFAVDLNHMEYPLNLYSDLTSGPNGIPDIVERVGLAFERAQWVLVDDARFGFMEGLAMSSEKYVVYLKDLSPVGTGQTATNPFFLCSDWSYINIHKDGYTGTSLDYQTFGCAHEYFHAIQRRYTCHRPFCMSPTSQHWIIEGTADWAGYTVCQEFAVDPSQMNFISGNWYFRWCEKSLRETTYDGFPYRSFLFWVFCTYHTKVNVDLNGSTIEDDLFVKQVFEYLDANFNGCAEWYDESLDEALAAITTYPGDPSRNLHQCNNFDDLFLMFVRSSVSQQAWYDEQSILDEWDPLDDWKPRKEVFIPSASAIEFSSISQGCKAIESYSFQSVSIDVGIDVNAIEIEFHGAEEWDIQPDKYFIMLFPDGEDSESRLIDVSSTSVLVAPVDYSTGVEMIIGRLDPLGLGKYRVRISDKSDHIDAPTHETPEDLSHCSEQFIDFSWTEVTEADGYDLQYIEIDSEGDLVGSWSEVSSIVQPHISVEFGGEYDGWYLWRVRAYKSTAAGTYISGWSFATGFTYDSEVPGAVGGLWPEDGYQFGDAVDLHWAPASDNLSGVEHYHLIIYDEFNTTIIDDNEASSPYYPAGLSNNSLYRWEVAAVDRAGNEGPFPASPITFYTGEDSPADDTPPSATMADLPPNSPSTIALSWSGQDQGGSGLAGFHVQWKSDYQQLDWVDIDDLKPFPTTQTTYDFDASPQGTREGYYFRGWAVDNA